MPRSAPTSKVELPEGFLYQPEFLSFEEHDQLLDIFHTLPFRAFDFRGYIARRRVLEYGWEYDFSKRQPRSTQPIPDFLLPLRERAAQFAGEDAQELVEAIIIEYQPGAPIGWHRDAPQFGSVVGVSLGSSCRMRFKPYKGEGRISSAILEPRSIYLLRGPARWKFQHSIPAVEKLRYSITFRTLQQSDRGTAAA